jgi:hypothetical protein
MDPQVLDSLLTLINEQDKAVKALKEEVDKRIKRERWRMVSIAVCAVIGAVVGELIANLAIHYWR